MAVSLSELGDRIMKSLAELKAIREKMQGQIGLRGEDSSQTRVVVGMATCGIASGARPVLNALSNAVQEKQLKDVVVTQTGCIGLCQYESIVEVFEPGKDKITYIKMTPEKAMEVVEQHLIRGQVMVDYTLTNTNL
jgi:NADP-reducing hydrogenase subunit HndB